MSTLRKPSTTTKTSNASSIATYSTARTRHDEVLEDYTTVRLYFLRDKDRTRIDSNGVVPNKKQPSCLITRFLFLFYCRICYLSSRVNDEHKS
jgi:hypothetical protein